MLQIAGQFSFFATHFKISTANEMYQFSQYIDLGVVGVERAEVREEMKRRMEKRVVKVMAGVADVAAVVVSSEGEHS